jgi:hypothetical protein
MKHIYTKEKLEEAVKSSQSIAGVCRILNIRPCGGNYKTISYKIKHFEIDTSHFTGKGWNVGLKFKPCKERPLSEVLIEDSDYLTGNKLKKRLFKQGLKEEKCEICGITDWNGKKLVLEIDHINGKNLDHRIENIRILCPNCHSQTPTHKGKNKLSALSEKREVEFRKFGESLTANTEPSL